MPRTPLSRRDFCVSTAVLGASALFPPIAAYGKTRAAPSTGYAYHPDFERFENNSVETFQRAQWINSKMTLSGLAGQTAPVVPYGSPMEYIAKVHTQQHIDSIDAIALVPNFTLSIGQVAQTAVAHALGAVRDVCAGSLKNAFCCIRPPGHHVQNGGELGFCCYANVVIAARFAREKFNIRKILIIDWDFHQGNGTHGFICGDNDILFFETFLPTMYTTTCDDFTPNGPDYIFPPDARRMNIQMPTGSTNDDFIRVFENRLVPAADLFKPELVLISAGFDCKKSDALGLFEVTAQGISAMTRIARTIADTYAGGKLVSLLEGGYADINSAGTFYGLAASAQAHLATLVSGDLQPEDPFYSGQRTIAVRSAMHDSRIRIDKGRLVLDGVQASNAAVTIKSADGKTLNSFSLTVDSSRAGIDLASLNLPQGKYFVNVKIPGKTIVLPYSSLAPSSPHRH